MPDTSDFCRHVTEAEVANRMAPGRIECLERALADALRGAEAEKTWSKDLESAIQEAIDNESLKELEGVNRMITCPQCGDRKERDAETCLSCDWGNGS